MKDEPGAEIIVLRPAMNAVAARAAHPFLFMKERKRAARYARDPDRFRDMEVCARRRLLLASRLIGAVDVAGIADRGNRAAGECS
jgi:hypothetical protein